MRRAYLAVLSLLATLVALVGSRYLVTASTSSNTVAAELRAINDATGESGAKTSGSETLRASSSPSSSASPSGSAQPGASASPGEATTTPPPVATTDPGDGGDDPEQPPGPCATYEGDSVWIGPIAHYGTAFVTIKVCGGALTTATGGVMMSNYEPQNSEAVAALDQLALQYYKTNISMIAYSGATETAAAYRKSLQSALTQAGL